MFDKILVSIFGGGLVIFIYWFFLGKTEKSVEAKDSLEILVKGGYKPEVISIPLGKETTLDFFRQDPSSCLEEVVMPDFGIRKFLPLNEKISVVITPKTKGEFIFSCGMNMFHGKIIVS